jgi:hypothetical protein
MSDLIDAALNSPVSPGVAAHVWQAHEEQLERNKTAAPLTVPGLIRWSVELGKFEFIPEDSEAGDSILDRIRMSEVYIGLKGTIHF